MTESEIQKTVSKIHADFLDTTLLNELAPDFAENVNEANNILAPIAKRLDTSVSPKQYFRFAIFELYTVQFGKKPSNQEFEAFYDLKILEFNRFINSEIGQNVWKKISTLKKTESEAATTS